MQASDYLLIVDYFSRYVEVAGMSKGKRAPDVISTLKDIFARHGIPEEIRSDNGPPFDSWEFTHFAKEWISNSIHPVHTTLSQMVKQRGQCKQLRTS